MSSVLSRGGFATPVEAQYGSAMAGPGDTIDIDTRCVLTMMKTRCRTRAAFGTLDRWNERGGYLAAQSFGPISRAFVKGDQTALLMSRQRKARSPTSSTSAAEVDGGGADLGRLPRAALAGGKGLIGTLHRAPRPARAKPLGTVPEVDALSVCVVTDSYHHAFDASRRQGDLLVQRYGFELDAKRGPRRALQSEWGLALHLVSRRGEEERQIMVDFGYTAHTLNNNLSLMGVSPARLDALVLSHGHYDHFGGLAGFLARHRRRLKPGLPLYLGGEECLCPRDTIVTGSACNFGALDVGAVQRAGLKLLYADRPALVADHAFSTGRIDLVSFERVLSPTRMRRTDAADSVPDDFTHEQATCFNVKGKGLVVITSCGHRGVVNSVRRAMAVSGIDHVHAVMGGFHLAPYDAAYLDRTLAELRAINPDHLVPMHCTGEAFMAVAAQHLPGKLLRSSTGSRYLMGAAAPALEAAL